MNQTAFMFGVEMVKLRTQGANEKRKLALG